MPYFSPCSSSFPAVCSEKIKDAGPLQGGPASFAGNLFSFVLLQPLPAVSRLVVYIFEFKVDKSAKEALDQIEEKGYAAPFAADERKLFKIGVSFDSKERSLAQWESE
ncbi:PD-(D/E)XK nuclease domain-containing protein [Selenomonas sp. AB3002]|uniref:PD-(D/E)XK nuclease domain-containing protein n=1 Tax=Selenomonas sp. AB3002 TaxID=1392502 RepID=UPI00068F56E2